MSLYNELTYDVNGVMNICVSISNLVMTFYPLLNYIKNKSKVNIFYILLGNVFSENSNVKNNLSFDLDGLTVYFSHCGRVAMLLQALKMAINRILRITD